MNAFKKYLYAFLRFYFFACVVRPLLLFFCGVGIRRKGNLPTKGPAIICANHNSHLDTLVLMSEFSLSALSKVRPVAAKDYWIDNGSFRRWFAEHIIRVVPIVRRLSSTPSLSQSPNFKADTKEHDLFERTRQGKVLEILKPVIKALRENAIVIFFPEGTRGNGDENTKPFKRGISYLVEQLREVPVYPVFLHGLGKVLPKGDCVPVPFCIDGFVGAPIKFTDTKENFMMELHNAMECLREEGSFLTWENVHDDFSNV